MKLIDKDALVAEIEKLLNDEFQCSSYDEATGFQNALNLINSFIDTLEVKEVDLQGEPQVKESAEIQHVNDMCKENGNSLTQQPVSEDLEKASKEWLRPQLDKSYANYGEVKMMELTHFDGYAMLDAIEFGTEWQKTKDESTTEDLGEYINELSKQFPEVSFAKLSRIAVRVAKWQQKKDSIR